MITDSVPPKSFISRYWNGNVALPVAFWLVGGGVFLQPIFFPPLLHSLAGAEWNSPGAVLGQIAALFVIGLVVLAWWAIGLWRSAGNHRVSAKADGRWTLWSHLARFVVVLVCLGLAPALGVRFAPLVIELYKVGVLGDPEIPAYQIRVLAGGGQIEVWGGIKHGLAAELAQVLDENPEASVLHLNSGGGRVGEARKLFDLVRSRRLDTFVRYSCTSACTSIFLAGDQRLLEVTGQLGFHSVSFHGMTAEDQRSANREWSSQLLLAGVTPSFIERAVRVPAASMWYPSANELLTAHVITSMVPPGSFPASGVARERLERASGVGGARSFLSGLGGSYLLEALEAYPLERDELTIAVQSELDEGLAASGNVAPLSPLIRNLSRRHAAGLPSLHEAGAVYVLERYHAFFSWMEADPEGICRAFLEQNFASLDPSVSRILVGELLEVSGRVVRASAVLPLALTAVPLISPSDWEKFLRSAAAHGLDRDAASSLENGGEAAECSDFRAAIDAALVMEGGAGRRVRGHLLRLMASL